MIGRSHEFCVISTCETTWHMPKAYQDMPHRPNTPQTHILAHVQHVANICPTCPAHCQQFELAAHGWADRTQCRSVTAQYCFIIMQCCVDAATLVVTAKEVVSADVVFGVGQGRCRSLWDCQCWCDGSSGQAVLIFVLRGQAVSMLACSTASQRGC